MLSVLEPHTVTVLTTDKCTAECRHCCMNSSPEREAKLSYEQIERALSQLFQNYVIKVVVFAGGEPTLLGKDLLKAIKFCNDNMVVSRVVTNAYWAHSPEAARAKCAELAEAGLKELNISMDDYHEPYIAFERVKMAYEAALQEKFRAVVIANACGPQSALAPKFLEQQFGMGDAQMQRRFDVDGRTVSYERGTKEQIVVLSNGNVQRLGRGVELIDDQELENEAVGDYIEELGGCPHAVRACAISPKNHLISCCGFELHGNPILDFGDLDKHKATDLLAKADDDVIVNMIAFIGPPRLMALLKKAAPEDVNFPRRRYQSYCEVCHDLVGIEKNRQALYKHAWKFTSLMLSARETMEKRRDPVTGRLPVNMGVKLEGIELVEISGPVEA